MKKVTSWMMIGVSLALLAGCGSSGSVSAASEPEMNTKAVSRNQAPSDVVRVKVGETITIPINIQSEKAFIAFHTTIGYNEKSVEIISSSLTSGENSFPGPTFMGNSRYIPKSYENPYYGVADCVRRNVEEGLGSTGAFVGIDDVKSSGFYGNVTLFAITLKGILTGETHLVVRFPIRGLLDSEGVDVSYSTLKPIRIIVE